MKMLQSNEVHEQLRGIDTEAVVSKNLTSEKAFEYFKHVLKEYRVVESRYMASGHHNAHDFWNYCQGNTDVLYFHVMLSRCSNISFVGFCRESNIISAGVDSAASTSPIILSSLSSASDSATPILSPSPMGSTPSSQKKRKNDASVIMANASAGVDVS